MHSSCGWYCKYMGLCSVVMFMYLGMRPPPPFPLRPCLPCPRSASVLVASAFHPSYGDKMMTCAESATDFKGCIVIRKGLEGESQQHIRLYCPNPNRLHEQQTPTGSYVLSWFYLTLTLALCVETSRKYAWDPAGVSCLWRRFELYT